jgi:hypothetical protein
VQIHTFLPSATEGVSGQVLISAAFPREGAPPPPPDTRRAEGWVDPTPTIEFGEEEKIKPRFLDYQHAP